MAAGLDNTKLMVTGIIMSVLASLIFFTHVYLAVIRKRTFSWEDGWLTAAWLVFIAVTSLYLNAGPIIFRLQDVSEGKIEPYATVMDDSLVVQKAFFVVPSVLWICLWLIKASLLCLYKRLMAGLKTYIIFWWIVVFICVVTLALAITSSMLSCSSMTAWFTSGACGTPRDVHAAYISLWYSYSVDVFTDLLVMCLPLGLICNLQMHWRRKITIGALFGLGWVCIAVSTIRATYLGHDNVAEQKFKRPSTSWLALWGIVEAAIAVIIGCGPGLYREAKVLKSGGRLTYNQNYDYNPGGGYIKATSGRSRNKYEDGTLNDNEMMNCPRATAQINNPSDSEEDLFPQRGGKNIRVTTSVVVSQNEDQAHAK
ncbi:uncharacterized protein J7T54_007672 [Emericellopsis cladophorae]|uniref:Rhodopsin domain-containing protein n=1 Tax=Emericellopsis cladophorae TaxID=2686198 RepID=A0A9P9XVB5_9HYPO|nr:uncharacterized protein J7T54_007672 [Emericellopsis cladophorae]KAI6778064.1 hypothetical protein J7T54_007672 [Emericellopsis cladophorae]